jgi:serine/threonine protein kinase/tetratricopeptide (TPR) repeat protein
MSSEPLVGKLLGHFLLLEQIGAGGMGVVYRAHDERLNRDVAIKVLPAGSLADDATRKRFQQEAQALARLNHPNIATVFDFDCQGTTDFLVMELLTRQTLAGKILAGPLPVNIVIKYGIQMAEGLAAAHQQGILHRDLKPGNLGLTAEGRVKLLDFGLAKLLKTDPTEVTQSMTGAGLAKGTLAYMAPEQLRGENIDTRVDIYAAGSVLYEMATAKRPHPQESGPLLINAILNQVPAPPSTLNRSVTPALEAVILKALEKDPNLRYQSAHELASDLERLQTATVPVALRQASRRRFRRLLRPAMLAAGVLLLAIASWQVSRRLQVRTTNAPRPTLLVGDFENSTGEPVFDNTLREMFTSSLEQSHVVQVFPTSRLVDVLQRMQRPPTQRIDESIGREICLREGLKGFLVGSIARFGRAYVLLVHIKSLSGSDIVTAKASAGTADDIPAKVDEIAETVRRKLGESLRSLKENSVPLAQVSSSSLDAVRYFTLGKQSLYNGDPAQAVLMFSKALELDPNFAMAHEYLGAGYEYLNQYDRGVEEIRHAAQLADRVSEPERLRIMAAYYATELDFQKECENYQLLAQLQPLDPAPYVNLGVCKKESYDYAAAVSFTEQAVQLVPQSDVRINLAADLLSEGDTEKALQVAQPLSREFANNLFAETVLGRIYVALGRFEDARRTFEGMLHNGPDAEIEAELSLADLDLATGQYVDAEKKLKTAIQSAERNHNRVSAAKARITLAEILLQKGSPSQASQQLAQVDLPPHIPSLALLLARTYAWTDHLQAANKSLREIDVLINQRDVPALQALRYLTSAEIALAQRRFADAVQAAQGAVNYQKSVFAIETLARSYAAAGMHKQAAEEYEVLLTRANELMDDTRIESFDEPAFRRAVDAHYRLGVLYQKLGRWGDSRTELQKFLSYWSHADAELEIYKDAQRLVRSLPASGVPTPAT